MKHALLLLCASLGASLLWAQSETGELRLAVTDPSGLALPSSVDLVSNSNQYHRSFTTDPEGKLVAKRLPFGLYRVRIQHEGFAPYADIVEIRSAIPIERSVTLAIAGTETTIVVSDSGTLIDPHSTGSNNRIGSETLRDRSASLPGRSVIDMVDTQPGWLLEANAVLHPRGSEYQVQYVVDGIPMTDNRSPSFAPEIEADDVQSMNILTAGYPAEYGRKLGGVIEVTTARDSRQGWHGKVSASGGSFDTAGGYAMAQYGWGRNTLSLSGDAARTDRYLDPPVEQNYTNSGTTGSFSAHYERDLSDSDRLGVVLRREQSRFLVPDEQVQQDAGQRQDRTAYETLGQFSYQHIFSPKWLADVRVMSRDLSASLWSNALSTPIIAGQDRGFREAYAKATVSAHLGRHELKAGVETDFGSVREALNYRITDATMFDPDTPPLFTFADRRQDREQALFVQDMVRLGNWTLSAGLRWDHYRLITDQSAVSPRLGAGWYWRGADLVLRASYDRVFQTPAFENLLLASSASVAALNDNVLRLPVRPSLGNFYEGGFTKGFFGKLRLDANYFRRNVDNFADDDVLLNTGVSFPIAFRKAEIHGVEVKLALPRWGPLSGSVGYTNMLGVGYLPVAGGLFLGDDANTLLAAASRFPITQDQRNTVRGRVRYQLVPRAWVALGSSYGSGLPVEFDGTEADAIAQYGQRIVDRLNLARGRVRPSFSLDASAGVDLVKTDKRTLRVQADVLNLTDRLNVINFAGLFSGTAIAAPRSASIRLSAEF
ncbi:TonB-dependent receptor plug [Candidatus Sulfopaludibacter sp. SbA4]|nr:TonB-dependent receptor plug [Candidatus Sulfopaludibacter sp. SbA4]